MSRKIMFSKIMFSPIPFDVGWLSFLLPLFALLHCGNAWAACPPQDIDIQCPNHQSSAIYDNPAGTAIADPVALCPAPPATTAAVNWTLDVGAGNPACTKTLTTITCADATNTMVLTAPSSPAPVSSLAQFSGKVPSGFRIFTARVTDPNNASLDCTMTYNFNTLNTSGGWGDPHITTVDGVHYDFQSAGEFTALRGRELEIQTRQTPVATTTVPGASAYSGLATCVAIYTAVAARVGKHRVSYQPNISGDPDPSGLQLRVDGALTSLGPEGINLDNDPTAKPPSGGRIMKSAVGDGIEIQYADGSQLIVTPAWWPGQQKWYLNVSVYGTTAAEGTFGKLARDSWLPALPNGSSLGPKPASLHERYVELFGKFADAWRVTDKTSLFDYAPGTSTATFTNAAWPIENPTSCVIPNQPSATPVANGIAERACAAIVDRNMKADCVFDVAVTGNPGFAKLDEITQQLQPGATVTTVNADKDRYRQGERVTFIATVAPKVQRGGGAPAGTVRFALDGHKAGDPVTLDARGRAPWTSSGLRAGRHEILASYVPAGWGGLYTASNGAKSYLVTGGRKGGHHGR